MTPQEARGRTDISSVFFLMIFRKLIPLVSSLLTTAAVGGEDDLWLQYDQASKLQGTADAASLTREYQSAGLQKPIRPVKGEEFSPPESPPAGWWNSDEAKHLIATVLSFQTPSGGWAKGVGYNREPRKTGEAYSPDDKRSRETAATIDNGSTTREIRFLAEAATQTQRKDCAAAVVRGIQWLLKAQYPCGGWAQFYPLIGSYHDLVTLNDDAMAKVLVLLKEINRGKAPFQFLDASLLERTKTAFGNGIACILKAQFRHGENLTGWCGQYDPRQLIPAKGRSFEPVALASAETSRLMQLLMAIESPDASIIAAVNGAGEWLQEVQLHGVAVEKRKDPNAAKGWDRFVVSDPNAPPLWARFYELKTMRPVFGSDDGSLHYSLDQIDYGRRVGYDWYDIRPKDVIAHQWPEWKSKLPAK